MHDYYMDYQYNIYQLIKYYNLKYSWNYIEEFLSFKNGQQHSKISDFFALSHQDPWLKQYSQNKTKLGQDILSKGTYTPIFYINKNNKKYIIMGKHRCYSLILNHTKNPINRKFLLIEIPLNKIYDTQYNLLWNNITYQCVNSQQIYSFLIQTGDTLTPYLWENQCIPFKPFNDEKLFEEWLNSPIEKI